MILKESKLFQLLFFISVSTQLSFAQEQATDITFTDLDGTSHNLYTYLDSGYSVVLDFSYEYCGPCYDWSVNVGHGLWDEHGPDGDNTLRMFHFDVYPVSDQDVMDYSEEWGVEYPVINLEDNLTEYPIDGYPTIFFMCPDENRTYYETSGYGYPLSQMVADDHYGKCKGNDDISSSISFVSASPALSSTICNSSPTYYAPQLLIVNNDLVFNFEGTSSSWIDSVYQIEIFKNGTYHSTQNVDPWSDNALDYQDQPILSPIPVESNDELTLICHYPLDNYANDDTVFVTIPSEINTPTSSDTSLIVDLNGGAVYFSIKNPEGEYIELEENQAEFSLAVDSCYSIKFINTHLYSSSLKDANEHTLVSFEAGDYDGYETPWLYFHVSDKPVNVEEHHLSRLLLKIDYVDVLGRSHLKSDLLKGIYFEVSYYTNGEKQVKKYYKHIP